MQPTNFDVRVDKVTALQLIEVRFTDGDNQSLAEKMGIEVMCKEYGDDDNWVGLQSDDYETIQEGDEYKTFELWFNIKRDAPRVKKPVQNDGTTPMKTKIIITAIVEHTEPLPAHEDWLPTGALCADGITCTEIIEVWEAEKITDGPPDEFINMDIKTDIEKGVIDIGKKYSWVVEKEPKTRGEAYDSYEITLVDDDKNEIVATYGFYNSKEEAAKDMEVLETNYDMELEEG